MADLRQTIDHSDGLVGGDHFDVERTVTELPDGRTVEKAWFTCLVDLDDPDSEAVFQKEITDQDVAAQGVISEPGTGQGAEREATVLFRLQPSETRKVRGVKRHWDIQVKLDNGVINTPFGGTIRAAKDATKTES